MFWSRSDFAQLTEGKLTEKSHKQKQIRLVVITEIACITHVLDRLEIRQLKILQALLRELNVTRVASEVGLTQQAVSDQLRKLRDIFGDPLFLRKSNGLTPTPFAKRLGVKIETLLRDFEQLVQVESFDPKLAEGTFTISATDYAQLVVLPPLINQIRKIAPKLKVMVLDFDAARSSELMAEGRIDLTVTFSGAIPDQYPTLTLFTEHHVCVASKHSSLKGRTLSAEEISSMPQIIATPARPNFEGSISNGISKAAAVRNAVITVPCFSFVPLYLESDDAIAFLPSRVAQDDQLIQLELEEPPADFEIIASWHPRCDHDPLHQWIIQLLQDS